MFLNNLDELIKDIDQIKSETINEKDILRMEFFAQDSDDPKLLRKLNSLSANKRIRLALAGNKNTPADILHKFVKDKELDVRHAVINNPALEVVDIITMTFDNDENIKGIARDRIDKLNIKEKQNEQEKDK